MTLVPLNPRDRVEYVTQGPGPNPRVYSTETLVTGTGIVLDVIRGEHGRLDIVASKPDDGSVEYRVDLVLVGARHQTVRALGSAS